jgi:hypothetical protein
MARWLIVLFIASLSVIAQDSVEPVEQPIEETQEQKLQDRQINIIKVIADGISSNDEKTSTN